MTGDHPAQHLLGQHVRTLRIGKGISQQQLADNLTDYGLRLSQVQVSRIEHGTRPTTLDEAADIIAALDATLSITITLHIH